MNSSCLTASILCTVQFLLHLFHALIVMVILSIQGLHRHYLTYIIGQHLKVLDSNSTKSVSHCCIDAPVWTYALYMHLTCNSGFGAWLSLANGSKAVSPCKVVLPIDIHSCQGAVRCFVIPCLITLVLFLEKTGVKQLVAKFHSRLIV